MVQAPVGFHCPVCVNQAARRRPTPRTQFGAVVGSGKPVVTYTVIGICAVMYLLQIAPALLPQAGRMPDVTSLFAYAPAFTSTWYPDFEPWRMLTSAVLHSPSNGMHILFNMLALWFVGRVIEPAIGPVRYAVLLVFSAFGGSVAVLFLTDPFIPTVGASGAVFGLFGALFIMMRSSGSETGGIVALVGINMVISFLVPNISWQGHLGGLLAGALCAVVISKIPRGPRRTLWQGLGLSAVALILFAAATLGVFLVSPY